MNIIPVTIDGVTVYVEIDKTASISPPRGPGEGKLEGAEEAEKIVEGAIKTIDKLGVTILTVCRSVHQKAYAAMGEGKPAQFEVEFGITLGGELGIPFISKGKGDAQFKIKARWGS